MAYQNQLNDLLGKEVKVNRGGPDSAQGRLLAIQSDHLVLHTKDSVVYINGSHVKSISENTGNTSSYYGAPPSHSKSYNFTQLLQSLKHQFVQINRGGSEKIEGFVAEGTQDYMLLVFNRELIRVPKFHIKSVSVLTKGNKSSGNKSSGNKSSGNKSSGNNKSNNKSKKSSSRNNCKSNKTGNKKRN